VIFLGGCGAKIRLTIKKKKETLIGYCVSPSMLLLQEITS